jgi:hypothetical protein
MKDFKRFAFWFVVEFVSFALVVANGRAYNQGNYLWTFITDTIIQVNGFIIGAKFARDTVGTEGHDPWMITGGAIGGASGSLFAIYLTKWLYGA